MAAAAAAPARAADFDKLDAPSLKEIPADAAFYSTMLRTREQVDIIAKSKAWEKLTGLPGFDFLRKRLMDEIGKPGGALEKYNEFIKDPENKQLVDLLIDMVSQEIFVYGGANASDFAQLSSELYGAALFGPLLIQATGNPKNLDQSQMTASAVFAALAKSPNLIQTPDVVIGFKLSKTDPAEAQIKRLEDLLNGLAVLEPKLKGRVKRVKAAGGNFLSLMLDSKLIPEEDLKKFLEPLKEYEEKPGQYDAVVKKLKDLKVTISLGVHKGYLLIALGESTTHLDKLGQGAKLIDASEFKPMAKHAGERITSINYLSKAMNAKVAPNKKDLENYMGLATAWLPKSGLSEKQQARMKKDLADLVKDMQGYIPEVGAVVSYGFLSKRGTESYRYDWSQNIMSDGSKPLTILNHVGGSPLMFVAGRSKYDPGEYPKLVKWIKLGHSWAEEIALEKATKEQKDEYQKAMKAMGPLFKRLDETTGKLLVPALADGQGAMVLDAKLLSKQWHIILPQAANDLPMFEPAFVFGVSDSDKLVKAFGEYRTLTNDFMAELRKLKPDEVPEFTVPAAKMTKLKSGESYAYDLPQEWGLDKQLQPNAGVGNKVAVVTLSQAHTERLLTSTPLKLQGGPLSDPKRNLYSASHVNWSGMLDAIYPWVEYTADNVPAGVINKDDVLKQTKGVFDVLKCFRHTSSATYQEGAAIVTHSETIIQDLGAK